MENKQNKNIIAAIILGVFLMISAYILALGDRYLIRDNYRVDKWTGKISIIIKAN